MPLHPCVDACRLKQAEERIEYLEGLLGDRYLDESGTVWSVPTAWAYFSACRALNEHKARIALLEAELKQLRGEST